MNPGDTAIPPFGNEVLVRVAMPPDGLIVLKPARELNLHDDGYCDDSFPCCLHRPSDHALAMRPIIARFDLRYPLIERMCEHGVGHPDPDSVAYIYRQYAADTTEHGCDGCCSLKPLSKRKKKEQPNLWQPVPTRRVRLQAPDVAAWTTITATNATYTQEER